jgi:osmotically-inducible protein OsmY
MNIKNKTMAMVTAMVLGIGLALPALAEDTSAPLPASTSMSQAGSDTAGVAKNAYHGAVTALDDTKITTTVKAGLVSGKNIDSNHIHVTTVAGVVTLSGQAANAHMSARAESIAKNTSGVRGVNNNLLVSPSAQN